MASRSAMQRVLMVHLGVAACGDPVEPTPDAPPAIELAFDIDVMTSASGRVDVWLLPEVPGECLALEYLPHVGACVIYSDVPPCGHPVPCLSRVAVVRDGVVLTETSTRYDWYPTIGLEVPDLFAAPGATLEIAGCGAATSIALPAEPLDAPVTTDLASDGEDFIHWSWTSPAQPTGIFSRYSIGVGAHGCQHTPTETIAIEIPWNAVRGDVGIATVLDGGLTPMPWGDAHLWNAAHGPWLHLVTPAPPESPGDTWNHPFAGGPVVIDGVDVGSADWRFRQVSDGSWRHELRVTSACMEYAAGEATDSIRICDVDGTYAATIPHVTPSNDLDFGVSGDSTFALAFGPVTLTREDDPAFTRPFTLATSFTHEIIPRPEVPAP